MIKPLRAWKGKMQELRFLKSLNRVGRKDRAEVGGKAASLGELIKAGFPVPPGFVVLTSAMGNKSKDLEKECLEVLRLLKTVAVRSSAVVEDSKKDSWAGELESYTYVNKNLMKSIRKCWDSASSARALSYKKKRGVKGKIKTAVIIQKMIDPDISGVCFTSNPLTKDKNQIVVEACWGQGELLAQGLVSPDTYILKKKPLQLIATSISPQGKEIKNGERKNIPKSRRVKQKLSVKQIKEVAHICLKIEKYCKLSQDIEWAIKKDKLYILQARPITTL